MREKPESPAWTLLQRRLAPCTAVFVPIALVGLIFLGLAPAWAQQTPNAGELLRQLGPTTQPTPLPPPQQIAPPGQGVPAAPSNQARVLVRGFHIVATKFPESMLQDAVKEYVGRELTFAQLEEAAHKISAFYRAHDLLARAYIPRQTVKNGIVEIDVLEDRLGKVTVDPAFQTRLDPNVATGIVENRLTGGDLLHPSELEEGVAVLNQLPGVAAHATLVPGAAPGQSDAVLKLTDSPLVTGTLQADNAGERAVGERRLLGIASVNDAFGRGDQETAILAKTADSTFGTVSVAIPVGYSGLTLGVDAAGLNYRVEAPFSVTNAQGYAWTVGATAAYPIKRAPNLTLTATARYDYKRLVDQALGADIDNKNVNVGTLGVNGTLADDRLGGGLNIFALAGTIGQLDLGANAANLAADAATARSNGTYAKLTANAARLQKLFPKLDLYLSASMQVAPQNLDSSEKFTLGGPNGVRAYPVNEANGDEGLLTTAELRWHVLDQVRVIGFYDLGWIYQHANPWLGWQPVVNQPNQYTLQGAGIGFTWSPVDAVQVKATMAHVIGANRGRDANGNDADGTRDKLRTWLVGAIIF
jgi:hemolysin activation/secretion protein